MNAIGPRKTYTDQDIAALRLKLREVSKLYKSQAAAARDANIAESTFSAFLNDKTDNYDRDKIAAKVDMFLATREEKMKIASVVPQDIAFQRTGPSATILAMCGFAYASRSFNAVVTHPGIGKTSALRHYAANTPRAYLVTISPSCGKLNTMLKAICRAIGIQEKSATELSWAIGQHFSDGGVLLIDEAQFLSMEAMEELRSLRDQHRIGVVVAGNEKLAALIKGDAKTKTSQIRSRIGMRSLNELTVSEADLGMIIEAWGITAPDQVKYLTAIAKKPGAYRNIAMTMQLAALIASGQEQELSLEHLQLAWSQLTSGDFGERG